MGTLVQDASGARADNSAPLGIVAGGGSMPLAIAARAVANQRPVHIVALKGEADAAIEGYPHTWVDWGAVGALLAALGRAGCREVVIVGGVKRPRLTAIRPDFGLVAALPELLALRHGGDDDVLTRVVAFFERRGFRIVGAHEVVPEMVAKEGPMAARAIAPGARGDISRAFDLIAALGPFDVGQAAVVVGGTIVAIEGAEGTDAMLRRAAGVMRSAASLAPAGVLAKCPKPGQEKRVDLPAIGPRTIELCGAAGLAGIAVEAGSVLVAEMDRTIASADAAGLFMEGVRSGESRHPRSIGGAATGGASAGSPAPIIRHLVGRRSRIDPADALRGASVGAALAPFGAGAAVAVSRRHVLAIAAAEPAADAIARSAGLRQWGLGRYFGGGGTAVVRPQLLRDESVLTSLATAAADAGLAAIALAGSIRNRAQIEAELASACERLRIAAVVVEGS